MPMCVNSFYFDQVLLWKWAWPVPQHWICLWFGVASRLCSQ